MELSPLQEPKVERTKSIDGAELHTIKKIRYTTFVVRHPFLTQLLSLIVIIVCGIYLSAANVLGFSPRTDNDYLIMSDKRVIEKNILDQAFEEIATEAELITNGTATQTSKFESLFIMYQDKSDSKNMLEPSKINLMNTVEKSLVESDSFKSFCLSDEASSPNCGPSSYISAMQIIQPDEGLDMLDSQLAYMANQDTLTAFSSLFFSEEFKSSNLQSQNMRALVQFGLPLDGYRTEFDRQEEQLQTYREYLLQLHEDLLEASANDEDVEVLWFSEELSQEMFEQLSYTDLSFAFCSMAFVFCYMWFHTKSLYLAIVGIFEVIASFVPGYFIYSTILQISYYQTLHTLAVFVILGIGADNVFVFTDAWNQMKAYPELEEDLELRLAVAFRRAARATLATSFTTFSAFMATGVSKIMPIATFAYFASCTILCDFVLCLTFYTPALIINHMYISRCWEKCPKPKAFRGPAKAQKPVVKEDELKESIPEQDEQKESNDSSHSQVVPINDVPLPNQTVGKDAKTNQLHDPPQGTDKPAPRFCPLDFRSSKLHPSDEVVEEYIDAANSTEYFFGKHYTPFIHRYRYYILSVFVIAFIIMASIAGQLQPLSEEEQWLPDGHFIQKSVDLLLNGYQKSDFDDLVRVKMVWGPDGLDRSNYDLYKPDEPGQVIWDQNFDLSPEENQEYLVQVCINAESSGLLAPTSGNANCFINEFKAYRLARNETFPVEQENFEAALQVFAELTQYDTHVVYDSNEKLRFVVMEFAADLANGRPYSETYPWYEDWEDFKNEMNSQAPAGVDNAFQTAGVSWCWMMSERSFVSSLLQGMGLAIAMAFIVLTLATQNIIVSLFATLSISGIVACVLGSAQLLGWQLGIAESISGVILIGFSVDYVVHIGELYVKYGKQKSRYYKVQKTLKSMGVSIIGGALTTFGSGVFLFACTILFFYKFAVLISLTICMSFVWSLGFLSTMLITFGPEKDFGSLKSIWKSIRSRITKKQQDEI